MKTWNKDVDAADVRTQREFKVNPVSVTPAPNARRDCKRYCTPIAVTGCGALLLCSLLASCATVAPDLSTAEQNEELWLEVPDSAPQTTPPPATAQSRVAESATAKSDAQPLAQNNPAQPAAAAQSDSAGSVPLSVLEMTDARTELGSEPAPAANAGTLAEQPVIETVSIPPVADAVSEPLFTPTVPAPTQPAQQNTAESVAASVAEPPAANTATQAVAEIAGTQQNDPATVPESDLAPDPTSDLASAPASDSASEPTSEPVSVAASDLASNPGSAPVSLTEPGPQLQAEGAAGEHMVKEVPASLQTALQPQSGPEVSKLPQETEQTPIGDIAQSDIEVMCTEVIAGQPIGSDGCAILDASVEGVGFVPDSAELTQPALKVLDSVASVMKEKESLRLSVSTHSQDLDDTDLGKLLARRRTLGVIRHLIDSGVDAVRVRPDTAPLDAAFDQQTVSQYLVVLRNVNP